ncbi:MAG: Asp-tRNA(Asn)/Glu-tRNA(Gln) amidotransferase subunit GatA [Myxococcales bacterium FL481]|nr:MAG: Asp-tRNA(Asn)/Glu-tRNA(Gln) amidotransferase subunit GatA [Myxococcales bacterium FL481]
MDHHAIRSLRARELAVLVQRGSVTAERVAAAFVERAEQTQTSCAAFQQLTAESALAAAREIDQRRRAGQPLGPLAGVPVGLKDNFVTRNITTTCGSRILSDWLPPYDSTHALRLRQADAVMIGKLAMDEFAMGSSNENTPFAAVRNPWALDHVPGGSSGGSAAAVAARGCALSLGSDTGGSIRQPASFCGLVGLKPTYGRVSRRGMIAFASSLDQAGPMTQDVRDAAIALGVLAGRDPDDATSLDAEVPDYVAACDRRVVGKKVGIDRATLDHDGLDPEVRRAFEASIDVLRGRGVEIVEVTLPHLDLGIPTYYALCMAESASNLARYDGVRYGWRAEADTLAQLYDQTRALGFGAEVKRRIMLGNFVLRAAQYREYYGQALRVRQLITRGYEQAFARCDAIASPTSPVPAFRLGERARDPVSMYLADIYTVGANLAGLPAISIPGGFSLARDRPPLPIGFQLVGARLEEPTLLAIAAAHEADTTWHLQSPPKGPA